MDSLTHFRSKNVYLYYTLQLHFKSYGTLLFFKISGLTPTSIQVAHSIVTYSYTPRTLRACCSQSKFRILKIRESSARAFALRTSRAVLTRA